MSRDKVEEFRVKTIDRIEEIKYEFA